MDGGRWVVWQRDVQMVKVRYVVSIEKQALILDGLVTFLGWLDDEEEGMLCTLCRKHNRRPRKVPIGKAIWIDQQQGCIQRGGGALGFPPSSLSFPPPPRIWPESNVEYKNFLGEHAIRPPRGRTNVCPPPIKKSCMHP